MISSATYAIFFFSATFILANASGDRCRWPQSCISAEIAQECGVLTPCFNMLLTHRTLQASHVRVSLFMESMCPDCQDFILTQLYPTFKTLEPYGIMNLTLIPYGNAQEISTSTGYQYQCQHGVQECIGNLIETCAIYVLNNMSKMMQFLNCIENAPSPIRNFEAVAKTCSQNVQIDYAPIQQCVNSTLGNQLQHEMALATNQLNPPHQYVPWVLVNEIHTESIQQMAQTDLLGLVCETYIGPKPSVCK